MIKKVVIPLTTLLLLTVFVVFPILSAGYLIHIIYVKSSGPNYTQVPLITSLNNTFLSLYGYMNPDGTDTRVFNSVGNSIPLMLSNNKTIFVDNFTGMGTYPFEFKSGYSNQTMPVIVGYNGNFTTADNSSLEMGNNFTLKINGYVDTSAGSNKDIVNKQDALRVYVSNAGNITATVGNQSTPDVSLVATNISSGLHEITLAATSSNGWARNVSNPIINLGTNGSWDDVGIMPKTVLKVGSTYYMYYQGDSNNNNIAIGVATSPDLINWTKSASNPIVSNGSAGTWDSDWVGQPSVIYLGPNNWKMLYEGKNATINRIGLATSTDGLTWTKYGSNPVIGVGAGGSWDSTFVGTPSIVPSTLGGYQYNIYYVGANTSLNDQTGLAYTNDFITFTKEASNPIIRLGSAGSFDSDKSAGTQLLIYQSGYLALISGFDGSKWTIGYATSSNGLNFTKYVYNPIFANNTTGWDSASVKMPVLYATSNLNYMFYGGASVTGPNLLGYCQGYKIGLATSTGLDFTGQVQLFIDGLVKDGASLWLPQASGNISSQVSASADDIDGVLNLGFDNTRTYGSAGVYNLSSMSSGYIFRNITIPAGNNLTITNANITLVAAFSRPDAAKTLFRAEKSANPLAYGATENLTARNYSTASVAYTTPAFTVNTTYISPNISSLVTELINSYSYTNGNMAFMWTNNGSVGTYLYEAGYSYDGNTTRAPILKISYTYIPLSKSVPDNVNNWTWMNNNVMPYANNITLAINGTEVLKYQPNTIVQGSVLPDRDVGDGIQNGTINWGDAYPTGFGPPTIDGPYPTSTPTPTPTSSYTPGPTTYPTTGAGAPPVLTTPPGFFNPGTPSAPGADIPGDVEAASGLPVGLFFFIFGVIIILAIGIFIHDKTKSLAAQAGIMGLCILFASLFHFWPLWFIVPFALVAGAATLAGKVFSY